MNTTSIDKLRYLKAKVEFLTVLDKSGWYTMLVDEEDFNFFEEIRKVARQYRQLVAQAEETMLDAELAKENKDE
jgi:hypothetical protein